MNDIHDDDVGDGGDGGDVGDGGNILVLVIGNW